MLTPTPTPTPSPEWVYYATYSGKPDTYWKSTWTAREYITPAPHASQGGWCDHYITNTYSDAACTTLLNASRTIKPGITITLDLWQNMQDWRHVDDRLLRQQYSEAYASIGGFAQGRVFYRDITPSTAGAPWVSGESWTHTWDVENNALCMCDTSITGITNVVNGSTQEVTVPAGTFTCYVNTITQSGKTITEYWDSSGAFPYAPIKIVDNVSFQYTDTKQLYSFTFSPSPTYTLTMATAGGNSGSATDLTGASPYEAGTVVNIQAAANNGSAFYNWTALAGTFGNANQSTTTFTMPAQDVTVTANFVVPTWIYYSTYSGKPDTYWKTIWTNREYVTPDYYTDGGWCDYYITNTYSDAACTTVQNASRTFIQVLNITLDLWQGMKEWRNPDDRLFRLRWSGATASIGGAFANYVDYKDIIPSTAGAPWTLGESWTWTEVIENLATCACDFQTTGVTHNVSASTESVTVPAGPFTCYVNTITRSGKTITEYWDASGAFPYAPIKIVDNSSFQYTDTKELQSSTVNLLP
jgi:hypothetical protein